MYHYTESGLENIYLKNGFVCTEEDGEEFVSFTNFDGIHQAIAIAICSQKKWMSAAQLKFLRKEFNLSQTGLGQLIYCDRQSIARWEKGEIEIPHLADVMLRALYLESIDKESHVSLTIESLADAEIADMQNKVCLEENQGEWKAIAA